MPEAGAAVREGLAQARAFVEQEEGPAQGPGGGWGRLVCAVAVAMSLVHLYFAYAIVTAARLRFIHVGFVLFLVFLRFAAGQRRHGNRPRALDAACAAVALAAIAHALLGGDAFLDRSVTPTALDLGLGIALVALVLEAARRTSGWVMPAVVILALAYAMLGAWLPAPWTHRGYGVARLVGTMYMTLDGVFGTPIDVSSSLIILFTIYGALLQFSGAGQFFLDFSFAALGGSASGPGRTVVLASFLLGGPSGSGVATTVALGSVAYPMLSRAGYDPNAAGGLLAAGGLGAILSPPVLGAAAFLIAEFLKISYLDVLRMAALPTCLYYFSLLLMVEIDARKYGMRAAERTGRQSAWQLARTRGAHFASLGAVVAFLLLGYSPVAAVFWAIAATLAVSLLRADSSLLDLSLLAARPPGWWKQLWLGSKLLQALEAGSLGMLSVGATCAAAGILVGVVTLTGLGLRFSEIVISFAGGSLPLTALYTSLIVWVVGLAVPVTASYIICAVIAAPALIQLGVPDFAAHMFVFYYAVLSEVSPPTALSPFAAAAITGGDPYRTTLQSWKYTLPAFVVPFLFVLDPRGVALLLAQPAGGSWWDVVWMVGLAALLLLAFAAVAEGWLLRRTTRAERVLLGLGGLLLVPPRPLLRGLGIALLAVALIAQGRGTAVGASASAGTARSA